MGARQVDEETIRRWISENSPSPGGSSYLVYMALLSQTGTDAPVPTIIQNTIGNIVWTRDGLGNYTGTLAGAFTTNKTTAIIQNNYGGQKSYTIYRNDENSVTVQTGVAASATLEDELLYETTIEIRVYP